MAMPLPLSTVCLAVRVEDQDDHVAITSVLVLSFQPTDPAAFMALVDLNLQPSDKQLRQFGFISLVGFPAVTWLWGGTGIALGIAGGLAMLFAVVGWLAPQWLKYPFVGLSLLTWPIGLVMSEVVLLFVFFVVFLPFGLWFRWRGRDALQLKLDRECESYWQDRPPTRPPQDYYRQS